MQSTDCQKSDKHISKGVKPKQPGPITQIMKGNSAVQKESRCHVTNCIQSAIERWLNELLVCNYCTITISSDSVWGTSMMDSFNTDPALSSRLHSENKSEASNWMTRHKSKKWRSVEWEKFNQIGGGVEGLSAAWHVYGLACF